ncbi:MAG TPA: transcription-repair coupling factor [Chloroflexia bacterium]|nr:transcription-repair coupling factor [Chloroflexia bacterium]
MQDRSEFQTVCEDLEKAVRSRQLGARLDLAGLNAAVRPFFLAALQSCIGRPLLVLTARPSQAGDLARQTTTYSAHASLVLNWPTPDTLPYERLGQDPVITAGRLETLAALRDLNPDDTSHLLIVASAKGLMQPTLSKTDFRQSVLTLRRSQVLDLNGMLVQLVRMGYSPESVVEQPGQFSRRGGIIDIYPPTAEFPVRIELFGDEIDSLRQFDPISQRSSTRIDEVTLTPPVEVPLWRSGEAYEALSEVNTAGLRPEVREEWQRLLDRIENGEQFEGIEQFMPYYTGGEDLCSLLDHLPSQTVVVLDGPSQITFAVEELTAQAEELRAEFENNGEMPPDMHRPYLNWNELDKALCRYPRLMLNRTDEPDDTFGEGGTGSQEAALSGSTGLNLFAPVSEYAGNVNRAIEDVSGFLQNAQRVVIVSQQAERLREQFEDRDIFPLLRKESGGGRLTNTPGPGSFNLLQGTLTGGWRSPDLALVLLTDREIFGWTKQAQRGQEKTEKTARTLQQRDAFLRDLKPGDYVVHIEHGVARYDGLIRLKAEGTEGETIEREYLFLKYADQDKLYVPIEQVDRVLPFSAPGHATPTLNKLGNSDWTRTKRKVRSAVEDISKELLALYSQRASKQGHTYPPDNTWQREMEEAFPYTETTDQLRAILDVKGDMEQPMPMDRLICGDVGYGKTEVALRAAFKAVTDNKQVAILVPTTILAAQHYATFTQRLSAFPTVIEQLSRFRSRKEQDEILARLAKGHVDIIIGTHRLLQKDVIFKDLGLLVVDEEQRFGVKHKERLKQMRQDVDVLTLSATPIPRTLHMSLAGVRDISIIETPPAERLPVKTYVTAFNEMLVREVILRELERGGQIFYVHNRVQSIAEVANNLKKLVPQARIVVGHGQMEEGELEKVMLAFTNYEADVLVCTTIIESGLDIPNANTLIVDNAVMYGLAQLYQLRGRVGRGSHRAYAYFLYKPGSVMTEDAQKRLDTMLETQELGAGFKIAMKDLEIRGAGNLLGAEQSGHIASVGFELYMRLLEEAVEQLKGAEERPLEAQVEAPTVNLSLPLAAYLPEDYIKDEATRLDMYRKLAAPLKTAGQIREWVRELEDRFGKLPEAARNLMYLLDVKVLAIRAGIESIIEQENEIYLRWPAPTLESEMRRKGGSRNVPERKRPSGRANVDPRRLMKEFGEALRITPNQMRLNMRILRDDWQDSLKHLLEELAS